MKERYMNEGKQIISPENRRLVVLCVTISIATTIAFSVAAYYRTGNLSIIDILTTFFGAFGGAALLFVLSVKKTCE